MFRSLITTLMLVSTLCLSPRTAVTAEQSPPAARWIPKDAVLVLEAAHPKPLLDLALSDKMTAAITSMPAYEKFASQPGYKQFQAVVKYLEGALQTDWRSGVQKLVGGGVALAVCPNGSVLLVVQAEEEKMLSKLQGILAGFAKSDAAKRGQPEQATSEKYRGATVWSFGGGAVHTVVGNRLLLGNRAEAIRAALDLRENADVAGLASLAAYRAARQAAPADAAATAFVNLAAVKRLPGIRDALAKSPNPLVALLLAGVQQSLRDSDWLAMGLTVEGQTLMLQAVADGKTTGDATAAFALPKAGEGAFPQLAVPRRIAALSFYRDLRGFYAAKDKLFPERTSGLIFFENMMGIFFTGRDLTEEVLAETGPEVRFVVAEQEYDPAEGTPQIKLPAFAAVFRLRHPKQFGEVTEEAWQKALGLVNFTRGQKAQPGMIIDRESHHGTKYSLAYFSAKGEKDKKNLDMRYNFRPAIARPGDYLVLSSTDALAKDLIDALQKETAATVKPAAGVHSVVQLDASGLASILAANRSGLVRNNMVEKGTTQAEAEGQIDLLTGLLKRLGQAKLEVGSREGQAKARLTVKLDME